jgi:hypothetical protein
MTETAENTPEAAAPAAAPAAVPTARFKLPTDVITPIELRNRLVKDGLMAETTKPQQMYAWVKSPGKTDPFPVKFYDAAGNVYDKQPAGDDAPLTRPGVESYEVGKEWWERKRTAAPAAAATAGGTTANAAPTQVVDVTEDESLEDAPEGEFEEAE